MDFQAPGIDQATIRDDFNPQSHMLFDTVVAILTDDEQLAAELKLRQLAYSAWLAALGLVEMIGLTEAGKDPLRHSDEVLLTTLENVFNAAVEQAFASARA